MHNFSFHLMNISLKYSIRKIRKRQHLMLSSQYFATFNNTKKVHFYIVFKINIIIFKLLAKLLLSINRITLTVFRGNCGLNPT